MNEGFTDISEKLSYKTKSFREYYSLKAENKNKQKTNNIDVSESEQDQLTYPNYYDYWNISLN